MRRLFTRLSCATSAWLSSSSFTAPSSPAQRAGKTAEFELECTNFAPREAAPIKAVTTRPDTAAGSGAPSVLCVFLLEEGKAVRHDITTGIQDNAVIELHTALPEGATIITGPYDMISRKLEDGDAVESTSKAGDGTTGESGFSVSISTQ